MAFTPPRTANNTMKIDGYTIVIESPPIATTITPPIATTNSFGSPSNHQIVPKLVQPALNYKNKNKNKPPLKPNNTKIISNINPNNKENIKKRQHLATALNILPGTQSPEDIAAAKLDAQNAQPNKTPKKRRGDFIHQPQQNNIFDDI